MSTPSQFATLSISLHAQYHAGTLTQAQYTTALALAIADYNSPGTLADRVQTLIDLNGSIVNSIRLFEPTGTAALVSDLPSASADGEFYVVTTDTFAGHGYLRVAGLWVDMGLVRGPTGLTPILEFAEITALPSSAEPSGFFTGTPEHRQMHLSIPRGLNAVHGLAFSATGTMNPNEILGIYTAPTSGEDQVYSPASSGGQALAAATAITVVTINRKPPGGAEVAWGTITWAVGGTIPTIVASSPTLPAGHSLIWRAPVTPDITLADVSFTLVGAS